MTRKKNESDRAGALLQAQVAWLAAQFGGEALRGIVEEEVEAALEAADRLKLHDVASRAAVKQTVRRLLVSVAPADSLADLVAELAAALHKNDANGRTRIGDLLSDDLVESIVDQALSMQALREALIRGVIDSPAYTAFASDLLYQGIRGYLAENPLTRNIPGASSVVRLGRAALSRATPNLESAFEEGIKKYITQAVKLTSEHSVELLLSPATTRDLRGTALEFWRGLNRFHLADFRRQISRADFGKAAALAHQVWTALRGSDYVASLCDTTVDVLFDRYETQPLSRLFADFGVTRELLVEEIHRHLAPAIKQLRKKKLLEPMLMRRLKGFYESEAALEILRVDG